jgi:hypothetical protein
MRALSSLRVPPPNPEKKLHMSDTAAIMRAVAIRLGLDKAEVEKWEFTGLFHDLDIDLTQEQREKHGLIGAQILEGFLPEECLHAIKAHDFRTGVFPVTRLDQALIAADALCSFFDKGGKNPVESQMFFDSKSWHDPVFDDRPWLKELILLCRNIGISPNDFFKLAAETLT